MNESLHLVINGRPRNVDGLSSPATLGEVLATLELRADRIAVELNGDLALRTQWGEQVVQTGDRLEIVHFVGGGCERTVLVPGASGS